MRRYIRLAICSLAALAPLTALPLSAQAPVPAPLPVQRLLDAHHAWKTAPHSVLITGTTTLGGGTTPLKITATRQEEILIERGTKKQVVTGSTNFTDDGTKLSFAPTSGGFVQLDVTGVFFLAQLLDRPLTASAPKDAQLPQGKTQQVHMSTDRKALEYGRIQVKDQFDVYIDAFGLLAGIARTFNETDSRFRYTIAYTFSDYKETDGVLLPYRIQAFLTGNKIEEIVVESYQFDVPAASSLFAPRRTP